MSGCLPAEYRLRLVSGRLHTAVRHSTPRPGRPGNTPYNLVTVLPEPVAHPPSPQPSLALYRLGARQVSPGCAAPMPLPPSALFVVPAPGFARIVPAPLHNRLAPLPYSPACAAPRIPYPDP